MCSLTGNFSIIQYDDLIGMQDRADPLGHDQGRRICRLLFQLPTKCDICLIVQRRKAVIKNEDLRLLRNRPRNGKALLLPSGYIRTTLRNRSFIRSLFFFDKFRRLCNRCRLFHILAGRIRCSIADI